MNIINLFSMFVGGIIGTFICYLYEKLTNESILNLISHRFWRLRFNIKLYIIDTLLHPKHVIWAIKHHINYWHFKDIDLYTLDDVTWNEFLMMLKPETRRKWIVKRKRYEKDKALFLQPIKDLLLKGEKQNEN
jgi:hypothetical protein